MATYQEEVAKGLELQKTTRDVRADLGAARNNADTTRVIIADLQTQIDAGVGDWRVRDQMRAANDELHLWLLKSGQFQKRLDDLNADISIIQVADARARNLQTQHGLTQGEFEQVFEVYLSGGSFEDAKRKAAALATKARGTEAETDEHSFNPPGSVRW